MGIADQTGASAASIAAAFAARRLTAAMSGNGVAGPKAVEAWVGDRKDELERIRAPVHGVARADVTLL